MNNQSTKENLVNKSNQTLTEVKKVNVKQLKNEIMLEKTIKNEDLVNNSNQSQQEPTQSFNELINYDLTVEEEVEVCEIQSFCLEDIIDDPSEEEIKIWEEMSSSSWDGELCSDEIRELWISELRYQISIWN